MNKYLVMLIKTPFVRARILSTVRGAVTAFGMGLATKGYVDESSVELLAGLVASIIGFWMGDQDVKSVDKKIDAALKTDPVGKTPDEIEREITKHLNRSQLRAPGKTGW